jgi:hypothetical protein
MVAGRARGEHPLMETKRATALAIPCHEAAIATATGAAAAAGVLAAAASQAPATGR